MISAEQTVSDCARVWCHNIVLQDKADDINYVNMVEEKVKRTFNLSNFPDKIQKKHFSIAVTDT